MLSIQKKEFTWMFDSKLNPVTKIGKTPPKQINNKRKKLFYLNTILC